MCVSSVKATQTNFVPLVSYEATTRHRQLKEGKDGSDDDNDNDNMPAKLLVKLSREFPESNLPRR